MAGRITTYAREWRDDPLTAGPWAYVPASDATFLAHLESSRAAADKASFSKQEFLGLIDADELDSMAVSDAARFLFETVMRSDTLDFRAGTADRAIMLKALSYATANQGNTQSAVVAELSQTQTRASELGWGGPKLFHCTQARIFLMMRDELDNDPATLGYSGLSDAQAAAAMVPRIPTVWTDGNDRDFLQAYNQAGNPVPFPAQFIQIARGL